MKRNKLKLKKLLSTVLMLTMLSVTAVDVSALNDSKTVISCVGDSITFGLNSTTTEYQNVQPETSADRLVYSYPARLWSRLGTDKFKVGNYGLGGTTALKNVVNSDGNCVTYGDYPGESDYMNLLRNLYHSSLNCNPDIVIMMFGTNDAGQGKLEAMFSDGNGVINWDAWKTAFKDGYRELIDDYKALESNPEIYLLTTPNASERMHQYVNPTVKEIAAENDVRVIDLEQIMNIDLSGTSDGTHLLQSTYDEMAEHIYERLGNDHIDFSISSNADYKMSISSDYQVNPFDLYAAAYKGGEMLDCKKVDSVSVSDGTPYVYDMLWVKALEADNVKFMCIKDEMEPINKANNTPISRITNNNNLFTFSGTSFYGPNKIISILIRDSKGKIAYVDQTTSIDSGIYEFMYKLPSINDSYTIKVGGTQSDVLVRSMDISQ